MPEARRPEQACAVPAALRQTRDAGTAQACSGLHFPNLCSGAPETPGNKGTVDLVASMPGARPLEFPFVAISWNDEQGIANDEVGSQAEFFLPCVGVRIVGSDRPWT